MDVELNNAAEAGNVGKLQELLARVTSPLEPKEWMKSTLLRATYEGRAKAVWTLLSVKADPASMDERRETALHWAARRGHEDIVGHLVSFKAEVNFQSPDGNTAMHLAAQLSGSIVAALLAAKADQTLTTREKRVPLHVAAESGCDDAAAKLLEPYEFANVACPAIELANDRGETPLVRAAAMGHIAVLQRMMGVGAKIAVTNWWGQGPLHLAAQGGHEDCAKELIKKEAIVDQCAQDGATPLHTACERGHVKVVELLLKYSASLECRASGGRSPILCSAQRGHAEVTRVLLNNSANIEDRTEEGRTPLSCAALRGHTSACRLLLEKHADPQAMDTVRQTALHAAAANGQVDTIELLLNYRSLMDASDASGRSPLMLAHQNKQEAAVRILLKRGAVLPHSLADSEQMAQLIVEVERDRLQDMVKESQAGSDTADMKAAEKEFEDSRQRLLALNARLASAHSAPAVVYLEDSLASVTAEFRQTSEAETNLHKSIDKHKELLSAALKKQEQNEKELKSIMHRANVAKEAMKKKQGAIPEMRKELKEVKSGLKASQKRSEALDLPRADADAKNNQMKVLLTELQNESASTTQKLAEVRETLEEWQATRDQLAILHAQSMEILHPQRQRADSKM